LRKWFASIAEPVDKEAMPGIGALIKRMSLIVVALLLWAAAPAHGSDGEASAAGGVEPLIVRERPALPPIPSGSVTLTPREIDALVLPRTGAVIYFPSIDRFVGHEGAPLQFRPLSLFAKGGRIRIVANGSESEQSPPNRQYYLASNATTSIGLAVDAASGEITGFALRGASRMQLGGNMMTRLEFSPVEALPEGVNSCGTDGFDLSAGTRSVPSGLSAPSRSAALAGEAISYQAVVAVDTDSEWLAGFGDDPVAAMDWITDLFLAMNVFYERDVETHLLIGDVILRVGSDPYSVASDRFGQLNEFGKYWKDNMGHVERQFAAMLSGRAISAYSFSGIAWLDQYCAYGRTSGSSTWGSYSFNAIGAARSPGNTALYVGHEVGHNMGSPHTHCYDPPVDSCYNGDASRGCFSGSPMCPAGGKGTIMSYCHVGGSSGAGCGTSNSEFHPIVQGLLEDRLASEAARGCISPYSEPPVDNVIFSNTFE
jgi:hypothetical protein